MPNPYARLAPNSFWRTAVAGKSPLEIGELWKPKLPLARAHKVATLGSCFAKYLRHALKARGYTWFDAEPSPDIFLRATQIKYNYGIFSARTGDIYTIAALRQWVSWALESSTPPEEVWESRGRFFDPFRPAIEPNGFASLQELHASRGLLLRAIRDIVVNADWLVLTLGFTEGWISSSAGHSYALAPGSIAGEFDGNKHSFKNYTFEELHSDLTWVIRTLRKHNARMRFLLTVSPVPLTATASGKHVLTATTYSKSLLRAVAGGIADTHTVVDYFPWYEIFTAPPFQGMFYESNKQYVSQSGVDFAMDSFFAALRQAFDDVPATAEPATVAVGNERGARDFWSNVLATRKALRGLI